MWPFRILVVLVQCCIAHHLQMGRRMSPHSGWPAIRIQLREAAGGRFERAATKAHILTKYHIRFSLIFSWTLRPLNDHWKAAGCGALRSATP